MVAMRDSHMPCWASARCSRFSLSVLIFWRESANNRIASRFAASAIGADFTEHQPSTAWSTARMPVESSRFIGVSSVAAGSRITAFGTKSG